MAGRNVTVNVHDGKGTVINVERKQAPVTGACCDPDTGACTITTEAECEGSYLGDGIDCDPNPCGFDCVTECLPRHVDGTVTFSGTYLFSGITFNLTGSGTLNDDLVDFGSFREFQSSSFGTAHVTSDGGCDETHSYEIEVGVRCSGDQFQLHLFVSVSLCGLRTATFAYGSGWEDFVPPITGVTFILTDLTGACSGTCSGSMTLTIENPCVPCNPCIAVPFTWTDCDDACIAAVCAADPFCCETEWDATCVSETALYCDPDPCEGGFSPPP
jgi:hypothetical protein